MGRLLQAQQLTAEGKLDEGPRLVQPVQLARVSRAMIARDPLPEPGAGSRAPRAPDGTPVQPGPNPTPIGKSGGPSAKVREESIIRLPDEMLFPGWSDEPKPNKLVSKAFTLAEGAASVFGVPLTYGVKANLDVEQGYRAFFGPGMLHNLALIKTDEDRADEPLTPISDWWKDSPTERAKQREHKATATASAAGGLGAWIKAEASGSVEGSLGLDAVKGKVKVGLEGKAGAEARGELQADANLHVSYFGGRPYVSGALSAELGYHWYYSLSPFIDAELTVQPPKIPIVTELYDAVSHWPVVRWFAPSLDSLTWTTKWRKTWTPIKNEGGTTAKRGFGLNVSGYAPNPVLYSLSTLPWQPMDTVTEKALHRPPASEELPKEMADDKNKVVGHEPAVTASARNTVRAKIGAARNILGLEKHWDANALTRLRKAIDAAKAKQKKDEEAATAKGGPKLATVDPVVPLPGSGAKKGPVAELETKADQVEKREAEVKTTEQALDTLDQKLHEVQSQAEGGAEGRKRGEATETYTEMGKNADVIASEASTQEGKETPRPGHVHLERPKVGEVDETGVKATDSKLEAEAEKRRTQAYRAMRDADEKVHDELFWATDHANAAATNPDLKTYTADVNRRRGDANVLVHRFDRFLAELDTLQKTVPQLDLQIKGYDTLIKDFADLLEELKAMGPRPKGGWDEKYVMLDLVEKVGKLRLKPEYRDARDHFFPDSTYHTGTEKWKLHKLTISAGAIFEPGHWYYPDAKSPTTGTNYWFWASDPYDREYPTIDHFVESVAAYWNREGRTTNQPRRAQFFNGWGNPDANLRVVPRYINEERGRREPPLTDEVTTSFSGSTRAKR